MKSSITKGRYLCSPANQPHHDESMETILSRDMVVAQQDYICGEIGAPTTIIQFRKDEYGDWDRIDSQISAITLRTSCDLLRRCVKNKDNYILCHECDAQHAELFHEITYSQIKNGDIEKRIQSTRKLWDATYGNPFYNPLIEERHKRFFVSYNCPMFGYRELIFPILFEGKVVAVFVIGQIKLDDSKESIIASKKRFLSSFPSIFDDYLHDCRLEGEAESDPEKYTFDSISSFIINKSHRGTSLEYPEMYKMKPGLQIPKVEDELSNDMYEGMIKTVCEWIDRLENLLVEEMSRKRESVARDILDKALITYHSHSASEDYSLSEEEAFWLPVNEFSRQIERECELDYVIIYGALSRRKDVEKLEIIATSNPFLDVPFPISFSLGRKPNDPKIYTSDSRVNKDLFLMLSPPCKDNSLLSLVYQSMGDISAASVAILIKYKDIATKESIGDVLITSLQNLTALISSRIAVRFENAAQEHLEKMLRLYKHEIVHLSSSVSVAINNYLGNPRKLYEIMHTQKYRDISQDASGTLAMFNFLSANIGVLVDDPLPPAFKDVRLSTLLYKWENIRRIDARDKGCDFVFKRSSHKTYTDPRYAELVVYNILTNAVKYSYDYSNIHMHCKPIESFGACIFSVTNFSFEIPTTEKDLLFEMGHRTDAAREYYPEGSGIGLWIVQRVMEILRGKVRLCDHIWLSDYNIPLLYAYMKNPSLYGHIEGISFKEAKDEYDRLSNEYIVNDYGETINKIAWIVSTYNWSTPTMSHVYSELLNESSATYQIRFEVDFNV